MIEKVWRYVEEQHMLAEHDYVVAGVSGGADSVCLLYMLLEFEDKIMEYANRITKKNLLYNTCCSY